MFGFSNDCKKDIKINIMLNALMEYDTNDIEKVIAFFHGNFGIWCHANKKCAFTPDDAYKIVDNNSFYVKAIKCIKCTANSINVRMKDRFDNYHLTKIDCDFPALVESLNF